MMLQGASAFEANKFTVEAIEILRRRGNVRALFQPYKATVWSREHDVPSCGQLVFYNTADNNKVTTVICNDPTHTTNLYAFTTGDIALSDNFDKENGKTIPVENAVFGAAKVMFEASQIKLFCVSDCIDYAGLFHALHKDKLLPPNTSQLQSIIALSGDENKMQRETARYSFMAQILQPLMHACDDEIIAVATKKRYYDDPLYNACKSEQDARIYQGSMRIPGNDTATLGDIKTAAAAVLREYIDARAKRLPLLPVTNPRMAKQGFGRKVVMPMIFAEWVKNGLAKWAVFYTRRYFMLTNPSLAYLFCLLHLNSIACEVSAKDDLWAYQVDPEPDEPMGALCSVKVDGDPTLLAKIRKAAPTRTLGTTNYDLAMHLISGNTEPPPLSLRAKQILIDIGWKQWFDACVVPICARRDVRIFENEPSLPRDMIYTLQTMSTNNVWVQKYKIAQALQ